MSKGEGRTNEGSSIVGSVLARQLETLPLCGILTHTADIEGQTERWEELAVEAGVDRDLFMVIPKSLLEDDLVEFTRQMKSAVLAPSFRKLKELSSTILTDSLSKASTEINNLTVLDFDHMVMRVAYGEGVWEGQVLFRLHTHFHRVEAEGQARSSTELNELIEMIRKVSDIPELGRANASTVVRGIRHCELYENGDSINSAHLGVTTGDVFEIIPNSDNTRYRLIVVTQACDLALRPDGNRKAQYVLLLHIVSVNNSEAKQERYMELPYYHADDASGRFAVDFLSSSIAPCWALDTCVFDDEGRCGLRLNGTSPPGLLPGWDTRFTKVLDEAKKIHEQYDMSWVKDEDERQRLLSTLVPAITSCGTVRASTEENDEVQVPLQRVMRLRAELAMDVVQRYAAYIARAPKDVDLARKA